MLASACDGDPLPPEGVDELNAYCKQLAEVQMRQPTLDDIGPCNACVQPRDYLWVSRADLEGIDGFELGPVLIPKRSPSEG